MFFGHEHPNKRIPLPKGAGGSSDIWYHCSHTCKLPGKERGVETQLKLSISFEIIIIIKKDMAQDCFTDHMGKTTIIIHSTPSFPLTLEPWSNEIFSMEAGAQSCYLLGALT